MYLAGILSIAYPTTPQPSVSDEDDFEVMSLGLTSTEQTKKLKQATSDGVTLQKSTKVIKHSQYRIKYYFGFRDELIVEDWCHLQGIKASHPKCVTSRVYKKLHSGHPGVELIKRRAKDIVYWPSMAKDIIIM